jgi:Domain of unknown function (DUF4442)
VKTSVTELPVNNFLGIQTATEPSKLLRLPSGEQYLNHLGTVHASAQLALAEATSGEFLLRHFGSTDGLVPVVRRLEAKFRKPANGAVTSVASAASESLARLDSELASKGRLLFQSQWSFTTNQECIRFPLRSSGSFNVCQQMPKTSNNRCTYPECFSGRDDQLELMKQIVDVAKAHCRQR